jgi:hypothetical protein
MQSNRFQRLIAVAVAAALLLTTATPRHGLAAAPAAPPAQDSTAAESEWLVMLYQNADDEVLEGDIYTDLNEAELVGSTDDVVIVSQFDRYDGAFDGDGDWVEAKRFLVTQDDDLGAVNSELLEDLGEVDSGAPETLADFLIWAISTFPAKKHALILSDHGAGWMGGWNDNAPTEGSALSVNEIDQALAFALAETGLDRFEFVGFDACLMSQVEALSGIAPYARYSVASEEVEPAMGWAYAEFLGALVEKPIQTGAELAKNIVNSYIDDDVRIQDDAARAAFVAEMTGTEQDFPPEEVAAEMSKDVTLTAVNLQAMPAYMKALNNFVLALTTVDPPAIARARTYAQSFESVFGKDVSPSFVDVGNFAKLVAEFAGSDDLNAAVKALQAASKKLILAEKHGPARPGATGLTIFFPVPDLLIGVGAPESEISYTGYVSRFAGASLWDDFLVFHYTNRDFDPDLADVSLLDAKTGQTADIEVYSAPLLADAMAETDVTTAPGIATDLSIAPIEVSSDEIAADETVLLGTSISVESVGYIFVEAALYDEESDSFSIEDRDFVMADDTQAIDGVAYPVWMAKDLEDFIFEWSPTVYTLSVGENEAFVLLDPTVYGAGESDSEYDVYGVYTFADSRDEREAVMTFDGALNFVSIFGFTGANGGGAPREITPRPGDMFTVYEEWLEADADGYEVRNWYLGDTLTFNGAPFTVTAYDAYPGEYSVAITVRDLNGNEISEYANVTVTE